MYEYVHTHMQTQTQTHMYYYVCYIDRLAHAHLYVVSMHPSREDLAAARHGPFLVREVTAGHKIKSKAKDLWLKTVSILVIYKNCQHSVKGKS